MGVEDRRQAFFPNGVDEPSQPRKGVLGERLAAEDVRIIGRRGHEHGGVDPRFAHGNAKIVRKVVGEADGLLEHVRLAYHVQRQDVQASQDAGLGQRALHVAEHGHLPADALADQAI